MPSRRIVRDINEDARDVARRKMKTKAFLKSRDERKRVEMRFAHLKTHHGFERMRLRGLAGARDEFHLAAIVQNLKTMALRLLGPPHPKCVHPSRNWAGRFGSAAKAPPRQHAHSSPNHFPKRKADHVWTFFDSIGQTRSFDDLFPMSGLPPGADLNPC